MLQSVRASVRRSHVLVLLIATASFVPRHAEAQGMTGSLIGTVKDEQGGALSGARARIQSPALIGGPATLATSETGRLRFPALPPGSYTLDIELPQFGRYHEENIRIAAGSTIERTVILKL
jgi:Carboxypeptidase regulatory-like domain